MINKVTLIGYLGRDPELKKLDNGTHIAKVSIATQDGYKDKNGEWQNITDWHNITVWGDAAKKFAEKYKKGDRLYIEGKLKTNVVENQDSSKTYFTSVYMSYCRDLTVKNEGSSQNTGGQNDNGGFPEPKKIPF